MNTYSEKKPTTTPIKKYIFLYYLLLNVFFNGRLVNIKEIVNITNEEAAINDLLASYRLSINCVFV